MRAFVVKVQLSLHTSETKQQVLVYNEDKSVYWQDVAGESILGAMSGKAKAFFKATRNQQGVIELHQEVSDPGW